MKRHSPFCVSGRGASLPYGGRVHNHRALTVGAVHEPPVQVSCTSGRFMNRTYGGRARKLRAPIVGDGLAHPALRRNLFGKAQGLPLRVASPSYLSS